MPEQKGIEKEVEIYCPILNGPARVKYFTQGPNFICPSSITDLEGSHVCLEILKECPLFPYAEHIARVLEERERGRGTNKEVLYL